jgi:signal transduction histidine kinase
LKLRTKFALLMAGIILIPVLVTGIIGHLYFSGRDFTNPLPNYHAILAWLHTYFPPGWNEQVEELAVPPPPEGLNMLVLTPESRIVASSFPHLKPGTLFRADTLKELMSRYPDHRFLFEPLYSEEYEQGTIVLAMRKISGEFLPEPRRGAWFRNIFLGLLFAAALTGGIMVNRLGRSILGLESATKRIAAGDLDFRLQVKGDDELASLTRSFEQMRRRLKEEEAKRSRFLMAVSHDLKTPLTSIEGYVEAIRDGLARNPQKLTKYLNIISEKSKALEGRILELIEFVKMETGEWKLKHEPIELVDYLLQVARAYQEDASVLKRVFTYRIDLPSETVIEADKGLLMRILENLLGNALRFTREGEEVHLRAWTVSDAIHIAVQDSGPGIPAGEIDLVFEPFYRGSSSRREQGFGLGLATVKSIIEAHGWRIEVRSGEGKGTMFLIDIPCPRGPES